MIDFHLLPFNFSPYTFYLFTFYLLTFVILILISNIKKNNNVAVFLTFAVAILSWLSFFISDSSGADASINSAPIFKILNLSLPIEQCILTCKLIAFLLVLLQAGLINIVINRHRFFGERTLIPGLIFVILIANLSDYQQLHGIFIANIFFILSWWLIAGIYNEEDNPKTIFNVSFMLAMASLFYPEYSYLLVLIFGAVFISNINILRGMLMAMFGFATLWYLYFSMNYILWNNLQFDVILNKFAVLNLDFKEITYPMIAYSVFIVILFAISFTNILFSISGLKTFIRLNLKLLFVWIFVAVLLWLISLVGKEIFYSLAIPASVMFSIYFANHRNKLMSEVLWFLLILLTVFNQLY